MSLKDEFRQALASEEELIATAQRLATEAGAGDVQGNCPTKAQWIFFVAGKLNETQAAALGEHLAECESCTAVLADIRSQEKIADRRFSRNKLVFASVAAAVVVVALLATWVIRSRFASETVTADLRNVTRGVDASSDSGVVLHRNTRHLRILLAPRATEGKYEIAVFDPMDRAAPVSTGAASSARAGDSLVLEVPLAASNLQPGPYLLGIRHDGSEWAYYTIRLE